MSELTFAATRFMGSFNLQQWTRIGAMNQLGEVGRVTPCAPFSALSESVVAAVGAQRTARPTLRFMGSSTKSIRRWAISILQCTWLEFEFGGY
jgi:hypothetical protein